VIFVLSTLKQNMRDFLKEKSLRGSRGHFSREVKGQTQGGWGLKDHSQAEHGLHGDKQGWYIEGLKEHLRGLFPVLTGVEWGLR
jgi:hypothetical protein